MPPVNGSAPKSARASAERPEPCSPPMPRISPARSSRSTSRSLWFVPLSRRRAEPRRGRPGRPGREVAGELPADHRAGPAGRRWCRRSARVVTRRPSLSTVIRSDRSKTSREPVRDVEQADAALLQPAHERVEQLDLVVGERGGRLVHDEQRGRRRASALTISTTCCWATPRRPTARRGPKDVSPSCGEQRRGRAPCMACGRPGRGATGSWPRKTFSATVRSGSRLNSWWMIPMPAACASRGLPEVDGRGRRARSVPAVRRVHPGDDLHEGRLAGAVLADDGVHLTRPHVEVDVRRGRARRGRTCRCPCSWSSGVGCGSGIANP